MYRRPKFLEVLLEIRRELALEADYDVELFAEMARSGNRASKPKRRPLGAVSVNDPAKDDTTASLARAGDT